MKRDERVARIKSTASGQWGFILPSILGLPNELFDGKNHPCPKCGTGDDRFSFPDWQRDGGCHCRKCFDEKNGDGIAAVRHFGGYEWKEALEEIERELGLSTKSRIRLIEGDYSYFVNRWCAEKKPGVTEQSLERNAYRVYELVDRGKGVKCVGLPIDSPDRVGGWAYYPLNGDLHTAKGQTIRGPKLSPHCYQGWIGRRAVKILRDPSAREQVKVVFKVEGITDMLALDAVIAGNPRYCVLTNNAGAGALLSDDSLKLLEGLDVVVIGDNDEPGRKGGKKYADALCRIARKVLLWFPPGEGQDLREWLLSLEPTVKPLTRLISEVKTEQPHKPPEIAVIAERALDANAVAIAEEISAKSDLLFTANDYVRVGNVWHETNQTSNTVIARVNDYIHRFNEQQKEADRDTRMKKSVQLYENVERCVRKMCLAEIDFTTNSLFDRSPTGGYRSTSRRKDWLVFKNGLLKLDALVEGEEYFFPQDPFFFAPSALPFDYIPGATEDDRPTFERMVRESLSGPEAIKTFKQFLGYCYSSQLLLQSFLILYGKPNTGKSAILSMVRAALGGNTASVGLRELLKGSPLCATLGKKANVIDEVENERRPLPAGTIKTFVAAEPLLHNQKYRPAYTDTPTAKLILGANHLPRFDDVSGGVWRRAVILAMKRVLSDAQIDRRLTDQGWWLDSGEMPAIANFGIEGYLEARDQGHIYRSQESTDLVKEAAHESAPELDFLKEHIKRQDSAYIPIKEFMDHYRQWCEIMNEFPVSAIQLGKSLRHVHPQAERILQRKGENRYYAYKHVKLKWPY